MALTSLRALAVPLVVFVDRRYWQMTSRLTKKSRSHGRALVITSAGSGNIGDQAMLESLLQNVSGEDLKLDEIILVVNDQESYDLSFLRGPFKVSVMAVPELLHGYGRKHFKALSSVARLARSCEWFLVIGADVMDGGYTLGPALRTWELSRAHAAAGGRARILGFSWNGRAGRRLERAARSAGMTGVELVARDPQSRSRLDDLGVQNVLSGADLVFSHVMDTRGVPPRGTAIDAWLASPAPRALVNISGLISNIVEQHSEYDQIADSLERLGILPLFLPHVTHEGASDLESLAKFRKYRRSLGKSEVLAIEELLTPSQIRWLARNANVTLTGRMHLAILSLLEGVPPIVLATQGKVEGLLEMFDMTSCVIDPTPGFGAKVNAQLQVLHSASISPSAAALPQVRLLSKANFDGLVSSGGVN